MNVINLYEDENNENKELFMVAGIDCILLL